MENSIRRLLVEPFQNFYESVLQYMPKILSFVLIFIAGILVAKILKVIALHTFRFLRMDQAAERLGLKDVLQKGGIRDSMTSIMSRLVSWLTVIVFFIIALDVLEVPEAGSLLRTFFLYLPNVLAAGAIVFLGYMLSNFLGRAALIACVNADVQSSRIIGKLVKLGVMLLATTMALEQLGIGKETIIVSFTIIFGGIVFSIALAFGLGGRDAAREFIEKRLRERRGEEVSPKGKDDEISHI